MLIEGNSKNFQTMTKFRPCTQNVWAVGCPARTSAIFISDRDGVSEVSNDISKSKNSNFLLAPCRTLKSIFHEYGIHHINFFSLDVEGFEAEVIATIDFDRVKIDVMIVELDKLGSGDKVKSAAKNERVHQLLTAGGMYRMPSDTKDIPPCQKEKKSSSTLYGSALYVSKEFRDDIC